MKTKVIITVDTEFSIGGAFADPINKKPVGLQSVFCEKNGQSHGLGFILDTLNKHNVKATFFVEALNANYFGHDLMGKIAHTIVDQGQDIQLHLHPCWQYFKKPNWQENLKLNPPNDDISRCTYHEIESLLLEGLDIFSRWGVARPKAIRTGNLCVNKDVYKAMHKTGFKFSSNIGVGAFKPLETGLEFYSGCHEIENCIEFPVLTYCDMNLFSKKHLKLLTITGCSWNEIESLLLAAAHRKMDYVVVLTHPFEFVKNKNLQYSHFFPNKINKERFDKLCRFLQDNKEKFLITTCSDIQAPTTGANNMGNNTLLEVSHFNALKRMSENFANDKINKF